jgi:hypothetical protein
MALDMVLTVEYGELQRRRIENERVNFPRIQQISYRNFTGIIVLSSSSKLACPDRKTKGKQKEYGAEPIGKGAL